MDNKKIDYRKKCLELLGMPEGTIDSEILSALQAQMAEWHPDKQKFTDYDTRSQAEEHFKVLNGLRQGLKLQKEQEKVNNGIVPYSEDKVKEESRFSAIYESLDLKVKLQRAQEQNDFLAEANKRAQSDIVKLKEQLKYKQNSEFNEKIDDIKHLYQPKKSFKYVGCGTLVAVLICQVKLVKSFLQETLGLGSFGVVTVLITLTILFLLINLYKYIQVKYVEEKIGFFTNPCNISDIDKGKMLTTKYGAKFHVLEESDFYLALDAQIKKSYMSQFLFVGQKEVLLHMVVDAIVTDLLNKQIISASCVYNGNRTFKMNDDDARLDEGVL